jgi:hypothetical protein
MPGFDLWRLAAFYKYLQMVWISLYAAKQAHRSELFTAKEGGRQMTPDWGALFFPCSYFVVIHKTGDGKDLTSTPN